MFVTLIHGCYGNRLQSNSETPKRQSLIWQRTVTRSVAGTHNKARGRDTNNKSRGSAYGSRKRQAKVIQTVAMHLADHFWREGLMAAQHKGALTLSVAG